MKKLVALTVLMTAAGCGDERAKLPPASAEDAARACTQFATDGLMLKAKNRAQLFAEVGAPLRTEVEVEPNRHIPEAQDSIFKFHYDGMVVQMRRPGPGGEMFEYVEVTKRKRLNYPYFNPGVSAANVIAVMGEPHQRDGNRLIYRCASSEAEEPIVFVTNENDRVTSVVFNYYVD